MSCGSHDCGSLPGIAPMTSDLRTGAWANAFIGIPWRDTRGEGDGCTCWGLVCRVYQDMLGIQLPDYEDCVASVSEKIEIDHLMRNGSAKWQPIEASREEPFDVILLKIGGYVCHVGVVAFRGGMLNLNRNQTSQIESYYAPIWRHRIYGFVRHWSLCDDLG